MLRKDNYLFLVKLQYYQASPEAQFRIWKDSGSSKGKDGSFWSFVPHNGFSSGFYLLGDSICEGYSSCSQLILVKDISTENILAEPNGFTLIWDSTGTGAHDFVSVYRLIPPSSEYSCLGDVAVSSVGAYPNLSRYRCVKTEYLKLILMERYPIWDDSETGANNHFAAYHFDTLSSTVEMGLFWSEASRQWPKEQYTPALKKQDSIECSSLDGSCE